MSLTAMIKLGSVTVAVASLAAAFVGWVALSAVWASASVTPSVSEATDSARRLISSADQTLAEVRSTLEVVGSVSDDVATQTEAAADALDEVATLTSERIPAALEAIEATLPALVDTAAVIDDTMRALAAFGIPYDPEVPFDQALLVLQSELDGLPETIASQGDNLADLVPEIRQAGADTGELSGHLSVIDTSLGEAQGAIVEFGTTMDHVEASARLGASLISIIPIARVATVVFAIAGLVLGYLGWRLADRLAGGLDPTSPRHDIGSTA